MGKIWLGEPTQRSLSTTIATLADAAVGTAALRIYQGARPVDGKPQAGSMLAEVKFNKPAFKTGADGGLHAESVPLGRAARDGKAKWAQIVDGAGSTVLAFDVGDSKSDAVLRLNTVDVAAGGLLQIETFSLVWPR